jgi:hypothetical protein
MIFYYTAVSQKRIIKDLFQQKKGKKSQATASAKTVMTVISVHGLRDDLLAGPGGDVFG